MTRHIIAVDGIDGSGKSFMARRLAEAHATAGGGVMTISVDEFRRPVPWAAPDKSAADRYYDDYYDLAALDRCLAAYLSGADDTTVPVYDSVSETITGSTLLELGGLDLVIVEGVFTLRVPTVVASPLVWLATSEAVATERILARDMPKNRTREHVLSRIHDRYFPAHRRYLAEYDPIARATLVIDNNDYDRPRLERIADTAPALLRELV